jgi:hypothetical protein
MKRIVVVLTLMLVPVLALNNLSKVGGENLGRVVLPNSKLLRCSSSNCFQLFSEAVERKAISPKQVVLDIDNGCIYGMTAMYEKSVPIDWIKSGIDEDYKQWFVSYPSDSNLYLWRVGPQKFAVQLSIASKEDEKRNAAEAGTRQVIYIAFGGKSACSAP